MNSSCSAWRQLVCFNSKIIWMLIYRAHLKQPKMSLKEDETKQCISKYNPCCCVLIILHYSSHSVYTTSSCPRRLGRLWTKGPPVITGTTTGVQQHFPTATAKTWCEELSSVPKCNTDSRGLWFTHLYWQQPSPSDTMATLLLLSMTDGGLLIIVFILCMNSRRLVVSDSSYSLTSTVHTNWAVTHFNTC